jgi:hypothetical protein
MLLSAHKKWLTLYAILPLFQCSQQFIEKRVIAHGEIQELYKYTMTAVSLPLKV